MLNRKNRKNSETVRVFSMRQMRIRYLIGLIIVVGSAMSYGIVGRYVFNFDSDAALGMVYIIAPMLVFLSLALAVMSSSMNKKMKKLADAIHEVSAGNLDHVIDLKNADEYTNLYTEFNGMVKELSNTRREMEAFVNGFAHEFKTPITSINGFADFLYETGSGIETEERMKYLKVISEQSGRLCSLSQNTLLLSKMNAMEIVSGKEDFSVGEQIRKCIILLERELEDKNIEIDIPEDADPVINANPELTQHIWINLLGNAVKFTPENGRIGIKFSTAGSVLSVSITDSGCGMDPQTASHVFERYYQHDGSSQIRGNGMGLAIAKRAAQLSGGDISVSSKEGMGTTFTVTFNSAHQI